MTMNLSHFPASILRPKEYMHFSQRNRKSPWPGGLAKVRVLMRTILIPICLIVLAASIAQSQCDWPKKIAFAIQRRYQTNENAFKALLAPPDEFNRAHALIENEMLSQLQFVTDSRLDGWLQQHSHRILSQLN